MSQNDNLILIDHKQREKNLTDRDKLIYSYHYLNLNNKTMAISLLKSINEEYYKINLHKDLSRALLCQAINQVRFSHERLKESEFYLVVYRLVKQLITDDLEFPQKKYFDQLKLELFKDLH